MNSEIFITQNIKVLKQKIELPASKSIANRYLILQALSEGRLTLDEIPESDDSRILHTLLSHPPTDGIYDAHHAGTTSRFLLAYLACQPGVKVLTGSEQLKKRPIAPLVDALVKIGANIDYLEEHGRLPVRVGSPPARFHNKVSIPGSISSQFLTSLLLVGWTFEDGLTLEIQGELASKPYLEMTQQCLNQVGIISHFSGSEVKIEHQKIN